MKHRILRRRRDGVKQHYIVGRKLKRKRNYGALFKIGDAKYGPIFRDFETDTQFVIDKHAMDTFKSKDGIEETWETIPTGAKQGLRDIFIVHNQSTDKQVRNLARRMEKNKWGGFYNENNKEIVLNPHNPYENKQPSFIATNLAHEIGHHTDYEDLVRFPPKRVLKKDIQGNKDYYNQNSAYKGVSMNQLLREEKANFFMHRTKDQMDKERLEQKQMSVPPTKPTQLKQEVQKKL